MPILGIVIDCQPAGVGAVVDRIRSRTWSTVTGVRGASLVVVTDTPSMKQEEVELDVLSHLPGVRALHVVFSSSVESDEQ